MKFCDGWWFDQGGWGRGWKGWGQGLTPGGHGKWLCVDLIWSGPGRWILSSLWGMIWTNWVSLSPVVRWSQFKRMPWSTVSNTAERSRRMRREGKPASDDMRRLFVTLTRAVSVLWAEWKSDWNLSKRLLCLRWSRRWVATTFSSTFDRRWACSWIGLPDQEWVFWVMVWLWHFLRQVERDQLGGNDL